MLRPYLKFTLTTYFATTANLADKINRRNRDKESQHLSQITKTQALIAHDGKKADMVAFALSNKEVLQKYDLVATKTTGQLLIEKCGLEVRQMLSGPLGGDAQIAGQVAEGKIEAVFFFVDPLTANPHD